MDADEEEAKKKKAEARPLRTQTFDGNQREAG
jgi:hypothetical protein